MKRGMSIPPNVSVKYKYRLDYPLQAGCETLSQLVH